MKNSALFSISEKDIKSLCDKVIFQRGLDYFLDNRVKDISRIGRTIIATVQGNENYEIEIIEPLHVTSLKDFELGCTCPYDDLCKHIIAVLLHISKTKNIPPESVSATDLDGLDKKDLLEFIENLAKENPEILDRVKELSEKKLYDEKRTSKKLKFLFSTYTDYKSMNQLIKELNGIRRQTLFLISNNKKKEAQTILEKLVSTIANPENYVDDSSGKLGEFLDKTLRILSDLVTTDEQKIAFLNTFFPVLIKDGGGYGDQIANFFIEIFNNNHIFLENYFMEKLAIFENGQTKNKRNVLYRSVSILLQIYEETKEHEKYINLCKRKLSDYDDMHLVEKLMELKRYEEAYDACNDLIKKRKASPFIEGAMGELKGILRKG